MIKQILEGYVSEFSEKYRTYLSIEDYKTEADAMQKIATIRGGIVKEGGGYMPIGVLAHNVARCVSAVPIHERALLRVAEDRMFFRKGRWYVSMTQDAVSIEVRDGKRIYSLVLQSKDFDNFMKASLTEANYLH